MRSDRGDNTLCYKRWIGTMSMVEEQEEEDEEDESVAQVNDEYVIMRR